MEEFCGSTFFAFLHIDMRKFLQYKKHNLWNEPSSINYAFLLFI